jgi:hypothetical protein
MMLGMKGRSALLQVDVDVFLGLILSVQLLGMGASFNP